MKKKQDKKITPIFCLWTRCGDYEKRGEKECKGCIYNQNNPIK